MNKDETIKEIFEATRNVIPGEYDTIDLFYKWHVNKQIELLDEIGGQLAAYEDISGTSRLIKDKIKELKGE